MDNSPSLSAPPPPCIIKLDQFQYEAYKHSRLEIHSPEGKFLTVIAWPIPSRTNIDTMYQLWCQACLLEVLLDKVEADVKLPSVVLNSVVSVINRIDLHLKRQMGK